MTEEGLSFQEFLATKTPLRRGIKSKDGYSYWQQSYFVELGNAPIRWSLILQNTEHLSDDIRELERLIFEDLNSPF